MEETYHFEPVFNFDLFESEFIKTKFGFSKDNVEHRERVDHLIGINTIRLVLQNSEGGNNKDDK